MVRRGGWKEKFEVEDRTECVSNGNAGRLEGRKKERNKRGQGAQKPVCRVCTKKAKAAGGQSHAHVARWRGHSNVGAPKLSKNWRAFHFARDHAQVVGLLDVYLQF